jgi:hypothetical protein
MSDLRLGLLIIWLCLGIAREIMRRSHAGDPCSGRNVQHGKVEHFTTASTANVLHRNLQEHAFH